ncbi:tRNA uridine(34) 5-carboxymethylaminomethyl modification radical SAM/GNAT enzyme Elp3 [Candidatus Woesearchaeota archaeon]|nr:tRNA uridine(34) 5-carboxymethylaminomethyl modification radical SAM/GNAT enzyme Elp3 [Candidatus Woesearchaeota archaeon]
MKTEKEIFREIIESLHTLKAKDIFSLHRKFNVLKRDILVKNNYKKKIPSNVEISNYATKEEIKKYSNILEIKPTRTASGVSVVAVMSKPHKCPHGKCMFCGGGIDSFFGDVPQSYTGKEPATRRAIRNEYDPYLQVMNRLEQYAVLGKDPQKIELIIMGGTFPSLDHKYQEEFVMYCFKAMNDFSKTFYKNKIINLKKFREFFELPGDINNPTRQIKIHEKLKALKVKNIKSLKHEQDYNETSNVRCVGLTLETRSDTITLDSADFMLKLGCTRLELGVQSVFDDVLKRVKRGHGTKENIEAIQLLKDLGFKLNFHMMPGLPGVSKEQDLESLNTLFTDERYRPDMLKIYPCMVIEGTELHGLFKKGLFKPLNTSEASRLVVEFMKTVPVYCRIMRVQRDIPTYVTVAGVDRTNLRQYVDKIIEDEKVETSEIRYREPRGKSISKNLELIDYIYEASGGTEVFTYLQDTKNNYILGFCRLRFPGESLRKEITKKTALIRELHVYGISTGFGAEGEVQHKGIGTKLLKHAEKLAIESKKNKMVIISGVGVREYYRKKHNYKKNGPYMSKKLI